MDRSWGWGAGWRFETYDEGEMPSRSAEVGEEKRAENAHSHHVCACMHTHAELLTRH